MATGMDYYGDCNYNIDYTSNADFNDNSDYIYNDSVYYGCGNYSDDLAEHSWSAPDPGLHVRLVPALLFLICLVGLVGNCLVSVVIGKHRSMRKPTYLYLLNLAVVNVFYLLITVPIQTVAYALTNWPFGSVGCKLNAYVSSVCQAVSVLTLVATGIDRYMAVMHSLYYRKFRTLRSAGLVIAAIWVLSLSVMTVRVWLFDIMMFSYWMETRYLCTRRGVTATARRLDTLCMFLGTYLLPQLALALCHCRIGVRLWKYRRPGAVTMRHGVQADASGQNDSPSDKKERRRMAKIVLAITVAFLVFWLPLHIVNLFEDFGGEGFRILFNNREILVFCFSYVANAVNPILYCVLSKEFRRRFKTALTCKDASRASLTQGSGRDTVTPAVAFKRKGVLRESVIVNVDREEFQEKVEAFNSAAPSGVDTEVNEQAAMLPGEGGKFFVQPGTNHQTPSLKRLTFLKVVPSTASYPDSGHESEDDEAKPLACRQNVRPSGLVTGSVDDCQQPLPRVV